MRQMKVRDREDALAGTRDAGATQGQAYNCSMT
jgi:hypothetical protein